MGLLGTRLQFVFGNTQSRRNIYSCQFKRKERLQSSQFCHLDSVILTSLEQTIKKNADRALFNTKFV